MANRLEGWKIDTYITGIGWKSRLPLIRLSEKKNINLIERNQTVSPSQLNKINFPTQLTRIDEEKRGAKIKGEKERNEKKKCKNHWGVKRMKYGYQYGGGGESFLPWSFSRRDQVVINYPETRICMRVDDDRTMKFLSRDKITELSRWFLLSQFYSPFSTLFRPLLLLPYIDI